MPGRRCANVPARSVPSRSPTVALPGRPDSLTTGRAAPGRTNRYVTKGTGADRSAHADVLERLREFQALRLAERGGPLADDRLQIPARAVRARAVADLADVGLERGDLQMDRALDVDVHVGPIAAPDVHLSHLVRLEPLAQQLREDQRVPGRWVYRVQAGVAGRPVVGVVDVALGAPAGRRVLADHHVRLEAANLADDVAPESDRVHEDAVLVVQEHQLLHAEPVAGLALLDPANLGQLRGRHGAIRRALVAGRAEHVVDLFALLGPLADRSGRHEFGVVWVRHDDENAACLILLLVRHPDLSLLRPWPCLSWLRSWPASTREATAQARPEQSPAPRRRGARHRTPPAPVTIANRQERRQNECPGRRDSLDGRPTH